VAVSVDLAVPVGQRELAQLVAFRGPAVMAAGVVLEVSVVRAARVPTTVQTLGSRVERGELAAVAGRGEPAGRRVQVQRVVCPVFKATVAPVGSAALVGLAVSARTAATGSGALAQPAPPAVRVVRAEAVARG
jgi:hypothetical protein